MRRLQEAFPHSSCADTTVAPLTSRQTDLLSWMARGKTREQAAVIVGIADTTTKEHLKRACLRLKAVNTMQAVAIAGSRE
jgi:DNA-binding CsgD family transcriptional regulator